MNAPTLPASIKDASIKDASVDARILIPGLTGRVIAPGDADYDIARLAWNLAVDQRPALVVQAADAADVAATVMFAAANGLRVAPQGTGHNAAPLGDLSGTVLLRTDLMREVTVNVAARSVRVGAGVLWGEVTAALAPHGLTALAGSSADVGVVGYTLGGGYSWLSRKHGLAISKVTAVELVTADGGFHRVDADTEPDLFWAVRGGGANVGIVCALEFDVLALSQIYAGNLFFPLERAREVLLAHARWSATVEDAATTAVRLLRVPPLPDVPEPLRGKAFVVINGAIDAPAARAEELLAPLRALGAVVDTFADIPTAALVSVHMDPPNPVPGIGDGMILDELSGDAVDALLALAGAGTDTSLLAVDLRALGGAAGRPEPSDGAIGSLPGRYLLFAVGIPTGPDVAVALRGEIAGLRSALSPWANGRNYGNFRELPGAAEQFFAPETLDRLQAIADRWDPAQLLQANHSVR